MQLRTDADTRSGKHRQPLEWAGPSVEDLFCQMLLATVDLPGQLSWVLPYQAKRIAILKNAPTPGFFEINRCVSHTEMLGGLQVVSEMMVL